jgi:hypothetical protein
MLGLVCTPPIGGDHELFSEREWERGEKSLSGREREMQWASVTRWIHGTSSRVNGGRGCPHLGDHRWDLTGGQPEELGEGSGEAARERERGQSSFS